MPVELSAARRATTLAALVVPAVLVAWDLGIAAWVPPQWAPPASGLVAFALVAWGIGASLALSCGLLRVEAIHRLARRPGGDAWGGALDGLSVWLLLIVGHGPAFYEPTWRRVVALALMLGLGAAARRFCPPRWRSLVAAVALVLALEALRRFSLNWDPYPRLLMAGVVVVAAAHLLSPLATRARALAVAAVLAVALALASTTVLAGSAAARKLLAQRSVHARTWTFVLARLADRDGDGASNLFGERDCDPQRAQVYPGATEIPGNGRDDNCDGADASPADARGASEHAPPRSKAHAAGAGLDVVILSVDSLRFDLAAQLPKTRAAMGPHARFSRAVSPTPRTVSSLSSTVRGRPYRQLRYDEAEGLRGRNPVHDPSPTLADVLRAHGYRTLTVPTHAYLRPETRVLAGFEALEPEAAGSFVTASTVADLVVPEIGRASQPVCLFVHYMESHHPFRYGERVGPESLSGLAAAVEYTDAHMAALVNAVAKARGRAPIVVLMGDHGEEFGEHGGSQHATSGFAEQVRVVLAIAAPGVPDGDFDAPVSTMAVPATVLDLLGIAAPGEMTIPSVLAYLTADAPPPTVAVSEARSLRSISAYTFEHHRLLWDPVRDSAMLFDSREDPFEARDLAQARPELVDQLLEAARAWDERH